MKAKIVSELVGRLKESGWLSEKADNFDGKKLIDKILNDEDAPLNEARVTSILEFGRIVHAEMSAIMDAARRGVSILGATLYCTTFPCHMCARHIISAGIKRVVFIEPYPKSLAKDLYPKTIVVDGEGAYEGCVSFESFVGISPNKYIDLFKLKKRKNKDGTIINWDPVKSFPGVGMIVPTYLYVEMVISDHINKNRILFGFENLETTISEKKGEKK